ncbi:hypothetical protein [Actinoalloteichus hymeniacidonis]|uniref:Uncharacterized protein n=1 Tax=Actinoalloteichus hymeniacidonis TaxID=340345 RepID=A0AAC9MYR5_9PSEU|nr:hypothetical protein [Actinoalloteichus hymeniacidonis]AOS63272.1 hypothetical protein TL08_12290 [Actinoalloteichus hymeniacidonis]MBB5908689.1 hypothetical protein [Actinoalloteichus hymeniacidonis]
MTGNEPAQPAGTAADRAEQQREVVESAVPSTAEAGEVLPVEAGAALPEEAGEADVVEQRADVLADEEAERD